MLKDYQTRSKLRFARRRFAVAFQLLELSNRKSKYRTFSTEKYLVVAVYAISM